MRRAPLVALIALAPGCVMRTPQSLPVSATQDWVQTLTFAQQSVSAGRFAAADSALATFAARNAATPEAREVNYWRALYLLDPANRAADPRAAVRQLDAYLADTLVVTYRAEARVLRSLAITVDSLAQAAQAAQATAAELRSSAAARPVSPNEEELQKEVQRLRDSLERANAEMDRIKRRLTGPRRPRG